mmetsp:Transcript_21292/g.30446  ORF Transcript_21292/g.30446 Transcript_21292/m.30446 type:complete len:594 (+) Transcript_21292:21-1802(+)
MANAYGFDFLKEEHIIAIAGSEEDEDDSPRKVRFDLEGSNDGGAEYTEEDEDGHQRRERSDLEKQFDVLQFLQTHRSSGTCFTAETIYNATGVDLSVEDENVAAMLARNPKVRMEERMVGEELQACYGYQAKFNIQDKIGLLAQINRCKNGIRARDLHDAYDGVELDINSLVTGGEVISVANSENKDRTLFPRGEPFLIELEGNVGLLLLTDIAKQEAPPLAPVLSSTVADATITSETGNTEEKKLEPPPTPTTTTSKISADPATSNVEVSSLEEQLKQKAKLEYIKKKQIENNHYIQTEGDARRQIRRGEAVWVGGQWFRVSSAIRENVPLSEQPPRAQAPQSVTLRKELSKKNEIDGYIRPFSQDMLPLDGPLREESKNNIQFAKDARDRLYSLVSSSSGSKAHPHSTTSTTKIHNILSSSASSGLIGSSVIRKRPTKHSTMVSNTTTANSGASNATSSGATSSGPPSMESIRQASSDPALVYSHARRHGCSTDIKEMYLATRADVPVDETDLFKVLVSYKLLEEGEAMRRPRMKRKTDQGANGKPKKRRYYERKNQRITNVHLLGTEMGAVLAQAAARQQQGKEVGDGGM